LNAAVPAAVVVALAGCGDDFTHCPPVEPTLLAAAPSALSETGLYDDIANDVIAADVVPFAPQFELWSDGAAKRRWIRLLVRRYPGAGRRTGRLRRSRHVLAARCARLRPHTRPPSAPPRLSRNS
jgi:hypothetical protein